MEKGIQYQATVGSKAKIAVVSPGLLPIPPVLGGSVETVIQKMAESTQKKFQVDIFGPLHPLLLSQETVGNINYYRFPVKPYSGFFQAVRSRIDGRKYSIIQVENRPLFIPRAKAANPGSKFICCLHSMIHTAPRLIRPRLTEKIFAMCDKVLVFSNYMLDRFASMFPRVRDKFHFIHLATDTDRFTPCQDDVTRQRVRKLKIKHRIPDGAKIILFAGRIIPSKGVDVLIHAFEQVQTTHPDAILVIVGSGWYGSRRPTPYIRLLRQSSKNVAGKIRFTNYVSCDELPLFFSMADIFVCPSQWDEPFGLVNVEAMAAGVPVVASAKGGIPEIVTQGINGFLVKDVTNPHSFARPIISLLNNPEMARTFGMNGRKRAVDYFNWDRAGAEMIKLYEQVLEG